jgi:RimJ/RimL family protein N-acetyltransferase
MTELQVQPIDLREDAEIDEFHDVYLAAELATGADIASPWMREEVRVMLQERGSHRNADAYVGRLDGRVVAAGFLFTTIWDNLDSADISVHVLPDERRRGHGTTALAALEAEALRRHRTLVNAEATWAYDAGPDGSGEAGPEFARARGYTLGLADVKRRLALPVDDGLLDALAEEAAPHHAAYTLHSWAGPVPDDLADGWVRLTSTLMTEAPMGELEREPEHADVAVLRANEEIIAKQGRTKYNTVALDASGDVVAYSDIATTVHEPGKAYQWGTLVRSDARGHRLGLAVKVANHRLLQRERPDLRELTTYNAEVNAHMIAVNERLGFAPVARLGEFQKRLTAIGG